MPACVVIKAAEQTTNRFPTMFKPTRTQHSQKAFTIIESLVVLAILSVLTMVVMALFIHGKKTGMPADATFVAPVSAPAEPSPAPAAGDDPE